MLLNTVLPIFRILIVVSVLCCAYVDAASYAYSHDGGVGRYNQDWMKAIKNNTLLKKISIPGTHQSLALFGGWAAETQKKSLYDQLLSGIRAFDVRCRHFHDWFPIHHGIYYQHTDFETVLLTMNRFLDNFPSEVLLVRVKPEKVTDVEGDIVKALTDVNPPKNTLSFEEIFDCHIKVLGRRVWDPDRSELTIGKVRGKIIILQNFHAKITYGLYYDSFDIQDNYKLVSNWGLYEKWESVKHQLNNANNNIGSNYFMNYLSGSFGSFPYFVASGNSDPRTNAPNLMTILTTPAFKNSYPDFPRVSCFIGICSIAFEGTNDMTTNYIKDHKSRLSFVGIIMADFPGDELIKEVINLNFP